LFYDVLMKANTFFIPPGKIGPEADLIERFFIFIVLFEYPAEAVKYFIKLFIIIIHIRQFKQELNPFGSLKKTQGFLQQYHSFFLLIQREISIGFEYIQIDIRGIQYRCPFQYLQRFIILTRNNEQVSLADQQNGRKRVLFYTGFGSLEGQGKFFPAIVI